MGKFRVAICGGGIGGLVTAVTLSRYPDINVDIYEATSGFAEIGAGIGVWPRVWKLLQSLDLTDDLERVALTKHISDTVDSFIYRKANQPEGFDFHKLQTQGSFVQYHRPHLLQVLLDHLPEHYGRYFGHRLQFYTEDPSGTISLNFENGAARTCDVLLGADGIKSAVRKSMLTSRARKAESEGDWEFAQELIGKIDPIWTGLTAYRAVMPIASLQAYRVSHPDLEIRLADPDALPIMHMGNRAFVVTYPVAVGKYVNFGSYHEPEGLYGTPWKGPWVEAVDKQELEEKYGDWDREFQALLKCVEKVSRWAIHESQALDSWSSGRVTLVGDSAHGMSPNQSSGAGQAIEDAIMIATLLGHKNATKDSLPKVLKIYDEIRRPMAEGVQKGSMVNGHVFGLQLNGIVFDEHPEKLSELVEAIKDNWQWCWMTTLDADIEGAISRLEQLIT